MLKRIISTRAQFGMSKKKETKFNFQNMIHGQGIAEVPKEFFVVPLWVKDHFAWVTMNKAASLTQRDPGAASKDRPHWIFKERRRRGRQTCPSLCTDLLLWKDGARRQRRWAVITQQVYHSLWWAERKLLHQVVALWTVRLRCVSIW